MTDRLVTEHIADGEYQVVRIHHSRTMIVLPDWVKVGDNYSAAQLCEWEKAGVEIEETVKNKGY